VQRNQAIFNGKVTILRKLIYTFTQNNSASTLFFHGRERCNGKTVDFFPHDEPKVVVQKQQILMVGFHFFSVFPTLKGLK